MGNAGRSAQSLPSSHSELSATAQVPRPAAPKAFAPEQKATDMAPSEQMPSYEDGHVFEHFIVAASFIALARSPDDRGMLSTTPRSVRISSSGVCGCGIGEASGIGDSAPYGATVAPLRPSSRSSGSTMRMLSLLSRSGITSAARGLGVSASVTSWSSSSGRACDASALQCVARIDQRASAREPQQNMRTPTTRPRAAKVETPAATGRGWKVSAEICRNLSLHEIKADIFDTPGHASLPKRQTPTPLNAKVGPSVLGMSSAEAQEPTVGSTSLIEIYSEYKHGTMVFRTRKSVPPFFNPPRISSSMKVWRPIASPVSPRCKRSSLNRCTGTLLLLFATC